jgi:hypothetical protein
VLALAPDSARLPAAVEIAGLVAQGPVVIVSARAESLRARCERLQLRRLPAVHLAAGTAGGDGEVLARIAAGGPLLVFASPAALQDPAVRASLRASRLAALAIEEAHALSEWSHELSPAAGSLPQAVGELEPAALVAHVPVAIPVVARDVTERLLLRHALRIELPLLRPNVTLECVAARGDARHRALLALVSRLRRPGLVLCRTAPTWTPSTRRSRPSACRSTAITLASPPRSAARSCSPSRCPGDAPCWSRPAASRRWRRRAGVAAGGTRRGAWGWSRARPRLREA